MKICSKCKVEKTRGEFFTQSDKKSGLSSHCKACRKAEYYSKKDEKDSYHKAYRSRHKEEISCYHKLWREANKESRAEYNKSWYAVNRKTLIKKAVDYRRKRLKEDSSFRVVSNLHRRVLLALHGKDKSSKTLELLGCSVYKLKLHLAARFQGGMSWDNYGEWHVDHVLPCASFDLTDSEQQKQCFHYTNLQPLWAEDNLKKGDSILETKTNNKQ